MISGTPSAISGHKALPPGSDGHREGTVTSAADLPETDPSDQEDRRTSVRRDVFSYPVAMALAALLISVSPVLAAPPLWVLAMLMPQPASPCKSLRRRERVAARRPAPVARTDL
jgi:hypothetical protein